MKQEVHQEVKQYADIGDLDSLRYIFVDALDVDPTFLYYEKDYEYCKAKGLLEPHRELTPFTYDQSKWDENYWAHLKVDLIKNFSAERMEHMCKVAPVVLADVGQELKKERKERAEEEAKRQEAARQAAQKAKPQAAAQTQTRKAPAASEEGAGGGQAPQQTQTNKPKRNEEPKRTQPKPGPSVQSAQNHKQTGEGDDHAKKVAGIVAIAAAAVAVGIIVFLVLT